MAAIQLRTLLPKTRSNDRTFRFAIRGIAAGDFIFDREGKTKLALLSDDGTVHDDFRVIGYAAVHAGGTGDETP